MKLTLEQEIDVLAETRDLPTGQRCRRLGYPEVTIAELENRFAVHKLAERQNEQEIETAYAELGMRNGISAAEARVRFRIHPDSGTFTDLAQEMRMLQMMQGVALDGLEVRRDRTEDIQRAIDIMGNRVADPMVPEPIFLRPGQVRGNPEWWGANAALTIHKVTGFVKVEALDDYMGDTIPDRVLDSLQVAREAGLKEFLVAYPALKVDKVILQQHDPVLMAKLGDRLLEIDYWE